MFVVFVVLPEAGVGEQSTDVALILEQGLDGYGGIRDTTLFSEGALSNGGGSHLFSGNTGQRAIRRALLSFDLFSISQGATITAVSLFLTVSTTRVSQSTQSLHRLTRDWGEGDQDASGQEGRGAAAEAGAATWTSSFYEETDWSRPGGDFVETPSATVVVLGTGTTAEWTGEGLVADVQGWVDGDENFGWILIGDESQSVTAKRYFSSENTRAKTGQRPRLLIRFQKE